MTDLVVLVVAPNKDVASKVGSVGVLDGIVLTNENHEVNSIADRKYRVWHGKIQFKREDGRQH